MEKPDELRQIRQIRYNIFAKRKNGKKIDVS